MIVPNVTFTGVDASTEVEDLIGLAQEFPSVHVEYAFLYSDSNAGSIEEKKYPPKEDILRKIEGIDSLSRKLDIGNVESAIHFCGRDTLERIVTFEDQFIPWDIINRVQLNLPVFWEKFFTVQDLFYFISAYPNMGVITQYKPGTELLYRLLISLSNHQVLFDASGGKGVSPKEWVSPFSNKINWGYAGGLNPDNIREELPIILESFRKSHGVDSTVSTWIDMESGIRNVETDTFSVDKCRRILSAVNNNLGRFC